MHLDSSTGIHLHENVPLAGKTTLCVGGPARFYLVAHSVDAVREAIDWAHEHGESILILGGGSNVVVRDEGWPGLVVRIDLRGISHEGRGSLVRLKVGAGEEWDSIVEMAVRSGWSGIECLSGIPGLVGAVPIQNVGAYGQEVGQTICSVDALDRTTGAVATFTNENCRLGYRTSRFKREDRDRYVVLSVTFELAKGGSPTIRYPDLERELEHRGLSAPSLSDVRETVLAIRRLKGMVIDPDDPDSRSAGSFFVNPLLTESEFERLRTRVADQGGEASVPSFPAPGGRIKVPAAWIIEHAGFEKGLVSASVGLSTKHSLAIINRGGATAAEIRRLAELIQSEVKEKFGVELEAEPRIL